MPFGKSDDECGPFSQLAFYRYTAPMPGNNLLADSQANSRSFISRSSVQSFQRDENPLRKLFIQPDSVILHRNFPAPVLAGLAVQMDNGGDVWFVVLQGVFNQVLQKLTYLKRVSFFKFEG